MRYRNMIDLLNSVPGDQQIREFVDIDECLRFLAHCEANHTPGERVDTKGFFDNAIQFHLMFLTIGRYSNECFTYKYFMAGDNGRTELKDEQVFHMFEHHVELLDCIETEVSYAP